MVAVDVAALIVVVRVAIVEVDVAAVIVAVGNKTEESVPLKPMSILPNPTRELG